MSDGEQPPVESKTEESGILVVPIPPEGFETVYLAGMMKSGWRLWGTLPMSRPVGDGTTSETMICAIFEKITNQVPASLLAFHIVEARITGTGLDHLSRFFFGLTLPELIQRVGGKSGKTGNNKHLR